MFQFSWICCCCCCSVTKSCPIIWNPMDCSLPLICPLLSPRVCSDSCPLSRWCYLTISSSTTLFSFCLHSFPASFWGSFPVSQLFVSGCQNLELQLQHVFPNGLLGLLSFRIDRIDYSEDNPIFNILRIWQTVFQNGSTVYYFHLLWVTAPITPHHHQHSLVSEIWL